MKFTVRILPLAIAAIFSTSAIADGYTYSPWLMQIGVTKDIQTISQGGKGMTLAILDTGIVATNPQVAGRISTSSACATVSFSCAKGIIDDNGHGTAVTSIAAGAILNTKNLSMVGVAPAATLLIEKTFYNGQATDADYVSGIRKATDGGASVINLSGTFSKAPKVIAAINYAASKGVYIVFAGGNDNTMFLKGLNTTGLTSEAIKHLVFAGSIKGAVTTKSTYSNTPGTGSMVDTAGVKTLYSSNWLMTPGDNIIAPNLTSGSYSYWSGTSFSAPMVSGSLILLEGTWKILKTNSTAADLLYKTATKLGVAGTYGNGELNLTKAFAPYGTLMVTKVNGTTVAANTLTTAVVAGGALGPLATVASKLATFTAFDGYTRNYTVNLSNLIATKAAPSVATLTTMAAKPLVTKFNGYTFSLTKEETDTVALQVTAQLKQQNWASLVTSDVGSVFGAGFGFTNTGAYSKAFYGNDGLAFNSSNLNVANGLVSLANGGNYFAYGAPIGLGNVRFAMTAVQTAPASLSNDWTSSNAKGSSVGLSSLVGDNVLLGISVGNLQEKHGVLGSNYDSASPLNFGSANNSSNVSLSLGYVVDDTRSVLFEASTSKVSGNTNATGFMTSMSDLIAKSWGVSFTQKNFVRNNDALTLSAKAPMRLTSGSADMFMQDVNVETGVPFSRVETVNLVPTGHQMDYKVSYTTPVAQFASVSFDLAYYKDLNNTQGNDSSFIGLRYVKQF